RRHTRSKRDWSSDVCSSDLSDFTGEVRTLKANEYLVLMPNEDTDAIAENELNDVRIVLNIDNGGYDVSTTVTNIPAVKPQPILRSEERRVGKECRER